MSEPLSAVLHGIQVRFTEKQQQNIRSGTAVPAVSVLLGSMHKAKRSGSVAKSNLNNDLKKACSASKAAVKTGREEPTAKRFMPSSPAIITASPVVFVLTWLSMAGYWRQIPSVPEAVTPVRGFIDLQQAPALHLRHQRFQRVCRCTSEVLSTLLSERRSRRGSSRRSEPIS